MPDTYQKFVGTFPYDFFRSCAIAGFTLKEAVNEVYSLLVIKNQSGDMLAQSVKERKGVIKKEAIKASGVVQVTGSGHIKIGNVFDTNFGIKFEATEDIDIVNSGDVKVEAVEAGVSGNVGANSIINIPVTIPGITAVTNKDAFTNGYDEETDESLYSRYEFIVQHPYAPGNKSSYMSWAREVAGVGFVDVAPLENGPNTVSVYIVDENGKIPQQSLIDKVQEYIDPNSSGTGEGIAPLGAHCTVKSSTAITINVEAKLTLSTGVVVADVQQDVEDKLNEYLLSIINTGKSVSYAITGSDILDVDGIEDWTEFKLNTGTSNIQISKFSVAVLGSVNLSV